MPTPELALAVKPLGGGWEKIGSGNARGVHAQGARWTHSLPGGSGTLSFQLRRNTRVPWPDLTPFTPIVAYVGRTPVWSGRIIRTPANRGSESVINVQAEGWYQHLNDDPLDRLFVHNNLSDWRNVRDSPTHLLASFTRPWNVDVGSGIIQMALPLGATAAAGTAAGVYLDAGPNNTFKRAIVTYQGGGLAGLDLRLANEDSAGAGGGEATTLDATPIATALTTAAYTFATPRRFLRLSMLNNSGGVLAGADTGYVNIIDVIAVTDTAYESANTSDLKASEVITAALAAKAPLISTDTSGITATTFNIPEYPSQIGYRGVADIINDVNAYHLWQFYLTPDPLPRAMFHALPTSPTYTVGPRDAFEFDNAGANDGAEIFNQVIAQYQDALGTPGVVTRTSSANTFPDRRGFTKTKVLGISSRTSSAAATQIADAYLNVHATSPMKGKVNATGYIGSIHGGRVHVAMAQIGKLMRIDTEHDPDTGARGRTGIITGIDIDWDQQTGSFTLDSSNDFTDAILARIGIISR